tara:strand:- start:2594 stop:2848 length:255 start_codon:yes stop_codon:yes gene_type:complete
LRVISEEELVMPNVAGRKFPYTPAGIAAARQAQAAQVPGNERDAITDAMSRVTNPRQGRRLKRLLGMTKRPTSAGTASFGDYSV